MHQAKKGNQWNVGMKANIGVDSVWGDAGYRGVGKRLETRNARVETSPETPDSG